MVNGRKLIIVTMKSLTKNYIYDLLYRVLQIITPLITAPYVSRVLGAEGIGAYSYTASICSYFTLFAILGSDTYGQREIAFCGSNKEKRSQIFWEIFFIRAVGILVSSFIYYSFCLNTKTELKTLFLLQLLDFIGLLFDVAWLMQGVEEFGTLLLRNLIIKISSIISLFVFVRGSDDLYIYVALMAFSRIMGNVSIIPNLRKYIRKPQVKVSLVWRHIKPIIVLFFPTIALSIYNSFDKIMLGNLTNSSAQNGFYEQGLKIITLAITIVASLGNVMAPRMALLYSENNQEKLNYYLYSSVEIVWMLAMPISCGIAAISSNLIPWFLGKGYEEVIILLKCFAPICVAMGLKSVIGLQYLIPIKAEKKYTLSIIIGLVLNVLLNSYFIPRYQAKGAVIASVISEYLIVVCQMYMIRKYVSIPKVFSTIKFKLFAAVLMGVAIDFMSQYMRPSILNTCILIATGGLIYFCILLLVKDTMLKKVVSNLKKNFFGVSK